MVGGNFDVGVEARSRIPCDLCFRDCKSQAGWGKGGGQRRTHKSLGFLDVLVPEEKLSIQVAQVDGVEVDNVDLAEPSADEILEELTADTAGAHHQHASLGGQSDWVKAPGSERCATNLLDAPVEVTEGLDLGSLPHRHDEAEAHREG